MHKLKYILILIVALNLSLTCFSGHHITLRINESYAPYEYINNNGKPTGFTIDIFKAINLINKFDFNIKSDSIVFNIYSTAIDSTELVTSIDSIPLNSKFIASEPFGYIDNNLITHIYSDINSWNDLKDKSVLITKDSPIISHFNKYNINVNFTFIKNIPEGLNLLSSGDYDAMISNNEVASFYINKHEIKNLSIRPLYIQPHAIRFVMIDSPKNRIVIKKINNALHSIKANGTYDYIYSNRFYPKENKSFKAFVLWIIIICVAFFMILIIYVIYIHRLYKSEKKKTALSLVDTAPIIAKMRKIYDSNPTATVYFDSLGHIKFINKAAHDLVNTSRQSKLYMENHSIFNHTILNDEMIENLKNNKPINFTYNLISKDSIFNHLGDYVLPKNRIYNIFILPLNNYDIPLNGYLAYIYDITAQHVSEHNNLKYITSLSQISDNNFLDISFYDAEENSFFTFSKNTVKNTGITYEKGVLQIHSLDRSFFIEEFLSILNGEKRTAKLTLRKQNLASQEYETCDVILNAIRIDANTTIGISLITTPTCTNQAEVIKNKELEYNLNFLLHSSGYQFLEYNPNTDNFTITTIDNSYKVYNSQQLIKSIHPDDYNKYIEIITELKTNKFKNAYLVLRFKSSSSSIYNYYSVNLHSCYYDDKPSDKIIGVYHNVTDNLLRLRELEEFKESATLICEMNNIGIFEYNLNEYEQIYIPYIFTFKYGIDDDNFIDLMDNKSRDIFNNLIILFNNKSDKINIQTIKILSPKTNMWIYFKFNIIPIRDDINQEIYKYMGFMCEIDNK